MGKSIAAIKGGDEPHAGERKYFRKYSQHTSYQQKLKYARELVQEFDMKVPVLNGTGLYSESTPACMAR